MQFIVKYNAAVNKVSPETSPLVKYFIFYLCLNTDALLSNLIVSIKSSVVVRHISHGIRHHNY